MDLVEREQRPLDIYLRTLVWNVHNAYEGGSTSGVGTPEKADMHRFTDLAEKILNVSFWVLTADTGLYRSHKELALRNLAVGLVHPDAPRKPASLEADHRGGNNCVPVTGTAILGYLRLPDPEGTIDRMTAVFRDVYTQIRTRRTAEVAVAKHAKERMVTGRLAYHTEAVSQPPDDSWICCICQEKDNVNLVKLTCAHTLHFDCMKNAGVFGDGPNTTKCPYCRRYWDRVDQTDINEKATFDQDEPWYEYDLAGVGDPKPRVSER
jgi:hypothetical protein